MSNWGKSAVVLLGNDLTEVTDFLARYELLAVTQRFNLYALAPQHQLTTLTDGLHVIPHLSLAEYDSQLLIVGRTARTNPPRGLTDWAKRSNTPLVYLNADQPQRFAFDAPLEDSARQQDVPTAQLAIKRLEYRASGVQLEGSG